MKERLFAIVVDLCDRISKRRFAWDGIPSMRVFKVF